MDISKAVAAVSTRIRLVFVGSKNRGGSQFPAQPAGARGIIIHMSNLKPRKRCLGTKDKTNLDIVQNAYTRSCSTS